MLFYIRLKFNGDGCTSIIAGKKATTDGSTVREDKGHGEGGCTVLHSSLEKERERERRRRRDETPPGGAWGGGAPPLPAPEGFDDA